MKKKIATLRKGLHFYYSRYKKPLWVEEVRALHILPPFAKEQMEEDFAHLKMDPVPFEAIRAKEYHLLPIALMKATIDQKKNLRFPLFPRNVRTLVVQDLLVKLHRYFSLSPMQWLAYLGDHYEGTVAPFPCFVFAKKREDQNVILFPDYEALQGHDQTVERIQNKERTLKWEEKKEIAFWRGSTTGGTLTYDTFQNFPRVQAVKLSLEHPDLIDAKFTSFIQGDERTYRYLEAHGYRGQSASLEEHLDYKYQLCIDGNSCAYSRFFWQLHANCLTFKQESGHTQWFYKGVKPWEHYVPVKGDLSDLPEKILWAKKNDAEAKKIAANANAFAATYLTTAQTVFYAKSVIERYAALFPSSTRFSSQQILSPL